MSWANQRKIRIKLINSSISERRSNNNKRSLHEEFSRSINILFGLRRNIVQFNPNIVHLNTSCSKFGIVRDYFCVKNDKIID